MAENDPKHRAKRWNERMKLIATFFNSSAIITVAGVVINPLANRHYDALADGGWILLLVAFGLHLVGQFALGFLRAEE
jgi:hypothetical protein